jgi:hypothetical protein
MPETIDSCPNNGDKLLTDKPPYPHINCVEGVALSVHWGWIGKGFLIAIVLGFSTTAGLSWNAIAGKEEMEEIHATDEKIQEDVHKLDRNIRKIDENQRVGAARTELSIKQLNKVLEILGVTERISAPPVQPTEMEPIE